MRCWPPVFSFAEYTIEQAKTHGLACMRCAYERILAGRGALTEDGLVPVIAQQRKPESVDVRLDESRAWFTVAEGYAFTGRDHAEIMAQSEESGTAESDRLFLDCDEDVILLKLNKKGHSCHTGRESCFYRSLLTDNGSRRAGLKDPKLFIKNHERRITTTGANPGTA